MRILRFQELKHISYDDLKYAFKYSNIENFDEIINKLQIANFLKHIFPKPRLDDLNVAENITINLRQDGYFTFKFVGLITIGNYCLIVYPKYIKNIDNDFLNEKKKIKQIIQVIDKYQSINSIYLDSNNQAYSSMLPLMIKILSSYFHYGLYWTNQSIIEENGEGNILWEQTINQSTAYIIKNRPYYLNLYTNNQKINEMDIIRRIHAVVITDICSKLHDVLNIFDLSESILTTEVISDFGDEDYIEYLLNKELNNQFITYKKSVLNDILQYIKYLQKMNSDIQPLFYGTTSFNLVWEKVCQTLYHDDLSRNINELHLKLRDDDEKINYEGARTLKDIVEKPIWSQEDLEVYATKTLELDALRVNHSEKCFEIYDGKYYQIEINDNKVSGQPGIEDITKQYLYQLAFSKLAKINNFVFSNSFVIPVDELLEDSGLGVPYAMASLDMLNELKLNKIKVIARDAQKSFADYLQSIN